MRRRVTLFWSVLLLVSAIPAAAAPVAITRPDVTCCRSHGGSHHSSSHSSSRSSRSFGGSHRSYTPRTHAPRTYRAPRSYHAPRTYHLPRRRSGAHAYRAPKTVVPGGRDSRGRLERSAAAKDAFMRQTGHPHGWPGHVVDHIVPLACRGADAPSNMQWQTTEEAKAKDRVERRGCSRR